MKKITIGLFIDTFFPMIDGVVMVVDNYAKELSKYANVIIRQTIYVKALYLALTGVYLFFCG